MNFQRNFKRSKKVTRVAVTALAIWISPALAPRCEASGGKPAQRIKCVESLLQGSLGWLELNETRDVTPTVGIEIEGFFPRMKSAEGHAVRQRIATHIVASLKKHLQPGAAVRQTSAPQSDSDGSRVTAIQLIRYRSRNAEYTWAVKGDSSLEPGLGEESVEIASPILRNPRDLELFTSVMADLTEQGFRSGGGRSGTHVHVGFEDAEISEIGTLTGLYAAIEKQVEETFRPDPERQFWTRESTPEELERLLSLVRARTQLAEFSFKDHGFDRNRGFNLQSLERFGTVEFRIFNGTLDARSLKLFAKFSQRLVSAVRAREPGLLEYLKTTPTPDLSLEVISGLIGVPLGEHAEAIKRISDQARSRMLRRHLHKAGIVGGTILAGELLRPILGPDGLW